MRKRRQDARLGLQGLLCLIAISLGGCVAAKVASIAVNVTAKAAGTVAGAAVGGVRAVTRSGSEEPAAAPQATYEPGTPAAH